MQLTLPSNMTQAEGLQHLLAGMQTRRATIEISLAELRGQLQPEPKPVAEAPERKRHLSVAGRAAIVAAQRARWAKAKAVETPLAVLEREMSRATPARKFSAASRRKMAAAQRARWAKLRAPGRRKAA